MEERCYGVAKSAIQNNCNVNLRNTFIAPLAVFIRLKSHRISTKQTKTKKYYFSNETSYAFNSRNLTHSFNNDPFIKFPENTNT